MAMRYHRSTLLVLSFAALSGCSPTTEPRTGLVVIVDQVSFEPSTGMQVSFTVRNVGSHPEHVAACGGRVNPVLERRRAADWHPHAGGACQAHVSHVPVPVEPGTSASGTTGAAVAERGTYRLVLSWDADGRARAASGPFQRP
jgi:hypothetical protein